MAIGSLKPGRYKTPRGQVLLTIDGVAKPAGDVDLSRNLTVEDAERYTNEFGISTLALSEVDKLTGELTLTFHQYSEYSMMMANLSKAFAVAQVAAQDQTVEFDLTDQTFPVVVPLGFRKTAGHVIEPDTGPAFVEGQHYTVHAGDTGFGFVTFLGKPVGGDDTGSITFDVGVANAKRFYVGSNSSITAKVEFIENVKAAADRLPEYHCYWIVQWRPDSDVTLIGDASDPRGVTVKGKIINDTTKPDGQQLGFVEIASL